MQWNIHYPELESSQFIGDDYELRYHFVNVQTIIDVLEVYRPKPSSHCKAVYEEGLGHNAFVNHIQSAHKPDVRILYVTGRALTQPKLTGSSFIPSDPAEANSSAYRVDPIPALSALTAAYMINHLGVSPVFIGTITTDPWIFKSGSACFHKQDAKGNVTIEGFYRYSCGYRINIGISSNVWFSYELGSQRTTYIFRNCPAFIKDNILRAARCGLAESLFRPLSIDAFIGEGSALEFGHEYQLLRDRLIEYEHKDTTEIRPYLNEAVKDLHTLSQEFHILKGDFNELLERLEYLLKLHKLITSHPQWKTHTSDSTSTADSLDYLHSKIRLWTGWANNYETRVSIRINLLFNLASQWDNQTNLKVAEFTSKISTVTQRDSSAMISMSAVTMLFLPGAFVSAIFSMVFFNSDTGSDGKPRLVVSPQWWIFPAITVPLTLLIFTLWNALRRRHNQIRLTGLQGPLPPPLLVQQVQGPHAPPSIYSEKLSNRGSHIARQ